MRYIVPLVTHVKESNSIMIILPTVMRSRSSIQNKAKFSISFQRLPKKKWNLNEARNWPKKLDETNLRYCYVSIHFVPLPPPLLSQGTTNLRYCHVSIHFVPLPPSSLLTRYNKPKLLPCQHTFCQEPCMEGLVNWLYRKLDCPECRAEHRVCQQLGITWYLNNRG